MIVVVGSIKGGVGKTTLALNFTVMRSATSKKLLLVDADEQKSASSWSTQRECSGIHTNWTTIELAGKAIYTQLKKLKQDYEDIIIDVGGRDTTSQRAAVACADVYVTPFEPSSLDVWTLGALKSLIMDAKASNPILREILLINKGDPLGSDNQEALDVLASSDLNCYPGAIVKRKAFKNSVTDGLAVIEVKNGDKKATQEITDLYNYVFY